MRIKTIVHRLNLGFTLIEVLIALAILSLSLTAIIKATSNAINLTERLDKIAIAQQVANHAVNLLQLGIVNPAYGEANQKTKMAGNTWPWRARLSETTSKHILKIDITVYDSKHHEMLSQIAYQLSTKPK